MEIHSVPTICILGDQGAGKTRLASIFPDSYCLDTEEGAASAFPPARRKVIPAGKDMPKVATAEIDRIAKLPYKDKRYDDNGLSIGAVALDTIDTLQQTHKYLDLLSGGKWKEPRQMWGQLLDDIMPVIMKLKSLRVPQIIISHVKIEEPMYRYNVDTHQNEVSKYGWRGIALQGAAEEQIKRYMDYILHLVVIGEGARKCFVRPCVWQDYRITAKDRHNLFKEILGSTDNSTERLSISIKADDNGFPVTKVMQVIHDSHIY